MAGPPVGDQVQPGHALLGGLDQVEPQVVADGQREAADLADRLARSPRRSRGGASTSQCAPRPLPASSSAVKTSRIGRRGRHAGPGPGPDDAEHHGVEVLHVDRAPAPDAAVDDLAGERRHRPVVGVGRAPRRGGRGSAAAAASCRPRPAPSGRPAWSAAARTRRARCSIPTSSSSPATCSAAARSPARVGAVVGGVDPDQVAAEVDDLGVGGVVLGHRVILPSAGSSPAPA